MIAIECVYHRKCMTSLKNRYKSLVRKNSFDHSSEEEQIAEARTFTELMSYIESSVKIGKHMFKLSELYDLCYAAKKFQCYQEHQQNAAEELHFSAFFG